MEIGYIIGYLIFCAVFAWIGYGAHSTRQGAVIWGACAPLILVMMIFGFFEEIRRRVTGAYKR
jgi:hypothetical protein